MSGWMWTLSWGEVRHDLVVGSCPIRPADVDRICEETGVGAVLSLQSDDCREAFGIDPRQLAERASRHGVVVVNEPMRDFDPEEQRLRLPHAVRALSDLLAGGHRTYVHCSAGINRAPLVVLAYLTFVEDLTVDEALAMIRRARPEASPYMDAYHGCREDLLAARRAEVGGPLRGEAAG